LIRSLAAYGCGENSNTFRPWYTRRMSDNLTGEEKLDAIRDRYVAIMDPLFFPEDPISHDIIRYFASLLRIVGAEDKGWDPYAESRAILEDINSLMKIELPSERFSEPTLTIFRLGLIFYNHIVEMDATYEVLTNLLRFKLKRGYSPNPYYDFLDDKQRKRFKKSGLYPRQKIDIIKKLSDEAGIPIADIIEEFYRGDLRNAISHSDFIFTDNGFRCRNGNWTGAFLISFEELDDLITKAKAFVSAFFVLEREARATWGKRAGEVVPYDANYKGLMEVLVDNEGLMSGFKVHWPNNSESFYRRTEDGIDMCNCFLDIKNSSIQLFVDRYAITPGTFSPLVEADGAPIYTKVEGSDAVVTWPL
jgi:hypothetical protein